ncbi:MAG: hypothetical protein JWM68_1438 [Verrucomicrobiales bacterium]|nr:hypothetical protein [Verrucomicrobiales bacterium]
MVIRIKTAVVAAWLLFSCLQTWAQAASEYQLKSAFIYNFLQFVEWPQESLPATNSVIVIGILGDDPFGTEIDRAFRDHQINGHPLSVRRYKTLDQVQICHALFVSQSERDRLPEILAKVGERGVFSVSDIEGFAARGGVLGFVHDNGKLRFEINVGAIKRARLRVSSKLLRLARIVGGKGS